MRTETFPELNTDLLYDLISWAEEDEKRREAGGVIDPRFEGWGHWDQGSWASVENNTPERVDWSSLGSDEKERVRNGVCNTAFCMAGQAVVQSGYRLNIGSVWGNDRVSANTCIEQEWTGQVDDRGHRIMRDVGHAKSIAEQGRLILGLMEHEANMIFSGGNELNDLKEFANEFCRKRGLPEMFFDLPVDEDEEEGVPV